MWTLRTFHFPFLYYSQSTLTYFLCGYFPSVLLLLKNIMQCCKIFPDFSWFPPTWKLHFLLSHLTPPIQIPPRGGSMIFLRWGCTKFSFLQNTSCIRKLPAHLRGRRGGCTPPAPSPFICPCHPLYRQVPTPCPLFMTMAIADI